MFFSCRLFRCDPARVSGLNIAHLLNLRPFKFQALHIPMPAGHLYLDSLPACQTRGVLLWIPDLPPAPAQICSLPVGSALELTPSPAITKAETGLGTQP